MYAKRLAVGSCEGAAEDSGNGRARESGGPALNSRPNPYPLGVSELPNSASVPFL